MEAVGLAASIIAIVDIAKKLKDVIAHLVGKIPKSEINPTTIASRILRDLEAMQGSLSASVGPVPLDAGYELRDACSTLELYSYINLLNSLSSCLSQCFTLSNHLDGKLRDRCVGALRGKATSDIIFALKKIEKEVSELHARFSMNGLIRIELAATKVLDLMGQYHSEISQRLDLIEDHLKVQVAKAEANPGFAETLVGVGALKLTGVAVKTSLKQASKDLETASAGLESQYLRLKVQTLTGALRHFSAEHPLGEDQRPREEGKVAHHYPTDDPSQQIEDVVLECIKLLRILRAEDKSTVPFLDIVSLEHLANQMLDLGMYEDARQTYQQVVRIYRACIQGSSPLSELNARVARAIIGLCAALQRLGKPEEALGHIDEAVLIYRFLNKQHNYSAELGIALNNMANYLRDSGKILAAVPIIDEAVNIRQELAGREPHLYNSDLVVSLLNASTCYSKVSSLEHSAIMLADKAVDISRELVLQVPGKYAAHLGRALHNRANRRIVLLRHEEAHHDIQEAVEIRRKLAASRPDVFGGGLIRSLSVAKSLAIHRKDETEARILSEEIQQRCEHTPPIGDIPIILSPTILPFHNPHQEFEMARDDMAHSEIWYHGSGDFGSPSPYGINSVNTQIDQVITPYWSSDVPTPPASPGFGFGLV